MSNISKCQHLKLYFRLKHEECVIEKSVEAFIVNSKSLDPEIWNSLTRDIDQSANERHKLDTSLKQTIINMYEELKSVRVLIDTTNVEKIEINTFKKKLQYLWKKIQEFKILCNKSIDTLAGGQSNIDDDLNLLIRIIYKHKNLNYVDNCHHNLNFKAKLEKEESRKQCDYDKIKDFSTLLAKTGHTGNWSEEDHLLYLKLRKKHKGIKSLVLAIQIKCPDLTKECIINHEMWYKVYLELREKQKLAVEEWRKHKQIERFSKISKEEETQVIGANRLLNVPKHKKAEVERKREMVKHWKEQRDKSKAVEEERLKKRLRAKRENKENWRRARAVKLKQLIAERNKNMILEEKECFDKRNVSTHPPFMSAFILHMYRLRDQQFLEKRKNIILSKKRNMKTYVQPIKYKFSKRNESTLLKETKAWQEKYKKIEIKNTQTVPYIKNLPKRMIVSWKSYEIPG